MANIQSKFGEGLSKIQEGIDQGKQKLQVTQEINQLRRGMKEAVSEKGRYISELGLLAHQYIREGQLSDPKFLELAEKVLEKDREIYRNQAMITELTKNNNDKVLCECGAALKPTDKFCGSCGKEVAAKMENELETIECSNCNENVPVDAKYCGCCGMKIS